MGSNSDRGEAQGRVALLGDSAHAMQPNLGQGGCMAIEDGYQLAIDLVLAVQQSRETGQPPRYEAVLEVCSILPPILPRPPRDLLVDPSI
jgi:2-polyprenyl-6-methoxyphenol hydroxylase-like FAD-dependent oxidoreductase